MQRVIILASSSSSRRILMQRLNLPFTVVDPAVDETMQEGEKTRDLVLRLAETKARAGATKFPHALVIGSDQVAYIDGKIIGKPGNRASAVAQLSLAAGRQLLFQTGLCLLDGITGQLQLECISTTVHFRPLTTAQIEGYVTKEPAFNCAGSFKSEGLGSALLQRIDTEDPTALLGLPLITLVAMLERVGVSPLLDT